MGNECVMVDAEEYKDLLEKRKSLIGCKPVRQQRLCELEMKERNLDALMEAGVDDWSGYGDAMDILEGVIY